MKRIETDMSSLSPENSRMGTYKTDYLEEYRNGNRARIIVSLAAKDDRMTAAELTEILTGEFADKIGYRRAMRHQNAPAVLVKKLSKDGEFMHCKCLAYSWNEATTSELHAGAKWMVENDSWSHIAAYYAEHSSVGEKTLRHLYNNCEDGGYLWESLLLNPNTPKNICSSIQTRMNKSQIRELENKIRTLKQTCTQRPEQTQTEDADMEYGHEDGLGNDESEQDQGVTMGGM